MPIEPRSPLSICDAFCVACFFVLCGFLISCQSDSRSSIVCYSKTYFSKFKGTASFIAAWKSVSRCSNFFPNFFSARSSRSSLMAVVISICTSQYSLYKAFLELLKLITPFDTGYSPKCLIFMISVPDVSINVFTTSFNCCRLQGVSFTRISLSLLIWMLRTGYGLSGLRKLQVL